MFKKYGHHFDSRHDTEWRKERRVYCSPWNGDKADPLNDIKNAMEIIRSDGSIPGGEVKNEEK